MLVEVNPLIVTPDREVARARREGHARRQLAVSATPTTPRCATPSAEDPQEQMAKERGLTYVKLDGDIGILGNGAGLVMSHARRRRPGRRRARRTSSTPAAARRPRRSRSAVEVILSNPNVKAVLFNIFGGITRCDEVANGPDRGVRPDQADGARSSSGWTAPTTRRAGGCSPRRSLPNVHTEATMHEAAEKVVELAER